MSIGDRGPVRSGAIIRLCIYLRRGKLTGFRLPACLSGIGSGLTWVGWGRGGLLIISPQLPLLVPGDVTVVAEAEDMEEAPVEYVVVEL